MLQALETYTRFMNSGIRHKDMKFSIVSEIDAKTIENFVVDTSVN
jgi:hypothetical protein